MPSQIECTDEHDDIVYPSAVPFVLVHVACLAAVWTGVTLEAVLIGVGLYWLRMFAIGAGYHRYFSHRAYATSRAFQLVLAVLAQSTAQKSVLWWAAKHRHHHLHSDTEHDVHSPVHKGFLYSHVGWIFARRHETTDLSKIADFARFPELMWLHRFELVPAVGLAVLCFAAAGWSGLVVGFFWSTVLVYHATFCINSLAHVRGKKRFVTGDESRNNWVLALVTMGEGWHNNHHAYQSSARQGFRWWEIDPTYYVLLGLSRLGIVWGLKTPPAQVLRNEQRLGTKVVHRAAEQLVARFNVDRIAAAAAAALHGPELATFRASFARAQNRTVDMLASLHLPHVPSRDELRAEARAMFAKTPSLDDIVDRAHGILLASVASRLANAT
ncbi:fatty acid desaturase [Rhodoplanes sp. TEM]|uniref:Fatty acid desaturase n=1 Tax=Rhodoplanes tepidamans TaxID=200616 RepID=A0ABT5J536_RHOTP|nr:MULTISPECIES: fatty acid desaturase [Rhodoplanes]MDC7784737.1 fatty acid desaturase [Rhodoplanes tepidamans]MDC7982204.1 fatty acid desaturase [Rhodoplanes sp. TEM]MDQ0356209.1 stearoyl-CoA desaturase (delta-9 desaturase) [Rhodoplanes tepidamans]